MGTKSSIKCSQTIAFITNFTQRFSAQAVKIHKVGEAEPLKILL